MPRLRHISTSVERDAVRPKSGELVYPSSPALKEPTNPPIADRTSAAHQTNQGDTLLCPPDPFQRKTGRGLEQSSIGVADAVPLSLDDIRQAIEVFELLDEWERRSHDTQIM
jgi:hypothetical protein